jgi:hypothetical protein
MSKGISLPINIIIILIVIVLVLAVISVFFLTTSGTQINRAEAEKIFSLGCSRVCNLQSDALHEGFLLDRGINENGDPDTFRENLYQSCVVLGYARLSSDHNVRANGARDCVLACGSCDIDDSQTGENYLCGTCCSVPPERNFDCTEFCGGSCP